MIMRCHISKEGVLIVEPASPVEEYAVRKWCEESFVHLKDESRLESQWLRGSKIIVHSVCNPENQ
jgi:hypothetical protein